jgi:transcriptional regulator with XRE-family HTH domain
MASGGRRQRRGPSLDVSLLDSRLRRVRRERGLTQEELARRAGVNKRTIERYDHAEVTNPPVRQLLALAHALECDLDDLIEDAWRPAPPRR